jgi:hypothetical protein
MGRDQLRVLATGTASLVLLIAATLVVDWFRLEMPGLDSFGIDLRSAHGCDALGNVCASTSLSEMRGGYPALAAVTFFGGLAFGAAVAVTVGRKLLTGDGSPSIWSRGAQTLGGIVFFAALGAGFVFNPDTGAERMMSSLLDITITITRTWAPFAMLGAVFLGQLAVYFARVDSSTTALPDPVPTLPPARAVVIPAHLRDATPIPTAAATVPPELRGKLRYAVRVAELSRGGIDARREDGSSVLVMWRDVIGVVARRLPSELGPTTFIDVVSTAGATVRVLPWTKLSFDDGRVLDDSSEAARALALLAVVTERCPDLTIDPATRKFIETRGEAAKLPDLATLAAHDERLA